MRRESGTIARLAGKSRTCAYVADRMNLVEWVHPVHGEQAEHLCERHTEDILCALDVLGIGAIGSSDDGQCNRCGEYRPHWVVLYERSRQGAAPVADPSHKRRRRRS